jgi:peptidoglycan/xylan/chitin deacetylase (PgdA/CDA1 family)
VTLSLRRCSGSERAEHCCAEKTPAPSYCCITIPIRQFSRSTWNFWRSTTRSSLRLAQKTAQLPSVAFTFDDGYRGVHTDLLPILRRAKAPATMFIPTAFLGKRFAYEALKLALQKSPLQSLLFDGRRLALGDAGQRKDAWHTLVAALKLESAHVRDERIDAIIDELQVPAADIRAADILSESELKVMAEQLEIGSHTVTHPNLSRLGREEARREMADSKTQIETITGKPCRLFAYPIGRSEDYTRETVELLGGVGFAKAFTAVPTTSADSDFEYPRVGIGDGDSVATLCLKLSLLWPALFRLLV